ncbi:Cholesteryl ester transfer protein [Tupaia chinensis]|uniref:Cholesteryl ester transfer protein n=1 Tax=Tupaia chinensis TaxID=246437 RepID=L9KU13_TUPCH|nr:Cholesteryl ester transfer protein [Tupaia chinensis]
MLATTLLTLALLGSAHACSDGTSYEAGIVCRITKPALLVLNQETSKVIQTAFQRVNYPDIKGEKAMMILGQVNYGLHNIQISHLSIASSQVELVDATSIDVSIQNVSVIFKGTLSYGYTGAWGLSINQSVDFEIDSAIDLHIDTRLTCDSGSVRTNAPNCYLAFHKLRLHLQGEREPGWIEQLFTNFISFTLKLVLKGQVCKEINVLSNIMADFVQRRADGNPGAGGWGTCGQSLHLEAHLPLSNILSDGDINVDISLTRSPVITATYLESHHKGHFIYKNVSEDLALPTFSPSLLGDSRMLYFWFSEHVLDSLAKAAFQDGRLVLSLTGDKFKAVLETWGFHTNQDIFQELLMGLPPGQAQVTVHCLKKPTVSCQSKGVVVNSPVVVKFLFPRPGRQRVVAYTFEEDVITTVQASYSKKKLFLRLLDFQYVLQRGEGVVGSESLSLATLVSGRTILALLGPGMDRSRSESIQNLLQSIITTVGIPEVMSRLEVVFTAFMNSKGLDLFEIIDPEIITQDGFLLLQMDFGFPEHLLVDFLQSLS